MGKRIFLILLLVIVGFAIYWFKFRTKEHKPSGPPPTPIAVKHHSDAFNKSVDSLMTAYFSIKDALVDADTAAAKNATRNFIGLINTFPIEEMKAKDTPMVVTTAQTNLADIKSNAESLLKQTDITEIRKDFSAVTEQMYPSFFKAINYSGATLYFENCPMAFGDDQGANWISNSEEIVNPYLGKNHPKYKATMLSCGMVKDSVVAR